MHHLKKKILRDPSESLGLSLVSEIVRGLAHMSVCLSLQPLRNADLPLGS